MLCHCTRVTKAYSVQQDSGDEDDAPNGGGRLKCKAAGVVKRSFNWRSRELKASIERKGGEGGVGGRNYTLHSC